MAIGFITFLLLIYFRNTILRSFFTEISNQNWSLISEVQAQDNQIQKKRVLNQEVVLEEVTFRPSIGEDGFRVVSNFDITDISCDEFSQDIHQLAILLYPMDALNEKFLIKVRDCVLNLKEGHPVKKWLNAAAHPPYPQRDEEVNSAFLLEIINSKFNLITDLKLKYRIIQLLADIPNSTLPEKVLRSYLFLMIGNVTKSNNILSSYINISPFENWRGYSTTPSFYHKLAKDNFDKILKKLFNHPADRRTTQLFSLYINSFFNDSRLHDVVAQNKSGTINKSSLSLRYIERSAPSLVHFLRLEAKSEEQRFKDLRDLKKIPLPEQVYWEWAFINIDPLIADPFLPELMKLEKENKLWFIYLMDNDKLSDWFVTKTKKSHLPGRRSYLRSLLKEKDLFMLSLFKLIQSGDIDSDLVNQVATFLFHE